MPDQTVTLVDLTHGGRLFRIDRELRTGQQTYFVDGARVDVRVYLAEMQAAVARVTPGDAWPKRIA